MGRIMMMGKNGKCWRMETEKLEDIDRKKLILLNPREYEHPFDKKALNTLEGTPGLDKLVREFYKHGLERVFRILYTGSYLKVKEDHFPGLYVSLEEVCSIIDLNNIPDMYIHQQAGINAEAIGAKNPMIVLTRRAVDWLSKNELIGLIGHEVGHVKSGHMLYHDMAKIIPILGDVIGQSTLGIGKVVSMSLEAALFHWYRMSELTADRAGLLACQDYDTYIKILIKISGIPKSHFDKIDVEGFEEQAREFQSYDFDSLDKSLKWQQSYGKIIRGQ